MWGHRVVQVVNILNYLLNKSHVVVQPNNDDNRNYKHSV